MGLGTSQARLLTLTSRLSNLELQAQVLSQQKMSLSTSSTQASEDYNNALNKQKVTVYNGQTSSTGAIYSNATANNMTNYTSGSAQSRLLKDSYGRVIVSQSSAEALQTASAVISEISKLGSNPTESGVNAVLAEFTGKGSLATSNYSNLSINDMSDIQSNAAAGATSGGSVDMQKYIADVENYILTYGMANGGVIDNSAKTDSNCVTYYSNYYNEVTQSGYNVQSNENMTNSDWLYSQLQNGNVYLYDWEANAQTDTNGDGKIDSSDNKGAYENVDWRAGDTTVQVTEDDSALAKAQAAYEMTQNEIQQKDNVIDRKLELIDTEHSAIQTELDSLKQVIGKNIERTFKLFS